MQGVVILGAGGHARETLGIFNDMNRKENRWQVLGFIDEDKANHGRVLDGVPVLGDLSWFSDMDKSQVKVICGVGDNPARRQMVEKALALGLQFCSAISPLAHISPHAELGKGIMIFAYTAINTHAKIGDHTIINLGCTVSHDTIIGDFCNINPGVHLAGNVKVGEGCDIGMGANVIQGVQIGSWSVVGAGAAVVSDLPANVTAVGVPARIIKTREEGWYDR
ncbi:MAG: acetyltransferase [Anaerolineae bacterium]